MKQFQISLLFIAVLLAGCGATATLPATEKPVYVKVECRNEHTVRNYVLQQLRAPNARDLTTTPDGDFLIIEVVFTGITRQGFEKMEELERRLKEFPGVLTVEIRNPVRETRQILALPNSGNIF